MFANQIYLTFSTEERELDRDGDQGARKEAFYLQRKYKDTQEKETWRTSQQAKTIAEVTSKKIK
jgi:hypothetical protein